MQRDEATLQGPHATSLMSLLGNPVLLESDAGCGSEVGQPKPQWSRAALHPATLVLVSTRLPAHG